jgi:hypothetical protein
MTMSMEAVTRTERGIVVGKPDVNPETPSHVPGVHEGNRPHRLLFRIGIRTRELRSLQAPTRATGVAPQHHVPIDPAMPFLTPP